MTLTRRRRIVLLVLLAGGALYGTLRLVRLLFPTEADRLGEHVLAVAEDIRKGEADRILALVRLDEVDFVASAHGYQVRFEAGDDERLVSRVAEAGDYLPLERIRLTVEDSEIEADEGRVRLGMTFTDEGKRYADSFDLHLRRAGRSWVLTSVTIVLRDLPPGGLPGAY